MFNECDNRLQVGVTLLADVLNNLVEPLSYKTMFFGLILLFFSFFMTRSALDFLSQHGSKEQKSLQYYK